MSILVVSVSHKSTSVSHLAQLALDAPASAKLAEQLIGSEHIDEAVVLVDLQSDRVVRIRYPFPRRFGRCDAGSRRHRRSEAG